VPRPRRTSKSSARRILLGLVARALRPGVKFDYVPVFEGPQGVGKSTLVKTLVGSNFYATLFGGLHQKDALMTLRGKWGVEISELAAFKKTDNETMKSFFSTDTDVFRPPYGRDDDVNPAPDGALRHDQRRAISH
jgi:putative DNA primase/helicase